MFEGYRQEKIRTDGAEIVARIGGDGPPLLLLHGYPQTHAMWHKVAPLIDAHFTVVATDLRGYGDSAKPEGGPGHAAYSKREMARDQAEVMRALGFETFSVAGHDRGGRVAHRLALDHADRVERLAVLDIAPTYEMYRETDEAFARAYWHWFFLIQPSPFPERLIGADPDYYFRAKCGVDADTTHAIFAEEALAEYLRCFRDPNTIRASCEDYGAAATIDMRHDEEDGGRKLACPVLALWGADGVIEKCFDALALWRKRAERVEGRSLPGGHYLAEELPDQVAAEFIRFFRSA